MYGRKRSKIITNPKFYIMSTFIEIALFAFTVAGYIFGMIEVWNKWSVKQAKHDVWLIAELKNMSTEAKTSDEKLAEKIMVNESLITHNNTIMKIEMEQVKKDRADRVRAVYEEIANLKKLHESDVIDLRSSIEKAVHELKEDNKEDHKLIFAKQDKIFEKFEEVGKTLSEVCAAFIAYKESKK